MSVNLEWKRLWYGVIFFVSEFFLKSARVGYQHVESLTMMLEAFKCGNGNFTAFKKESA